MIKIIISNDEKWMNIRWKLSEKYLFPDDSLVAFKYLSNKEKITKYDSTKIIILFFISKGRLMRSKHRFQNNQYYKIHIPENIFWMMKAMQ